MAESSRSCDDESEHRQEMSRGEAKRLPKFVGWKFLDWVRMSKR